MAIRAITGHGCACAYLQVVDRRDVEDVCRAAGPRPEAPARPHPLEKDGAGAQYIVCKAMLGSCRRGGENVEKPHMIVSLACCPSVLGGFAMGVTEAV